MGLLNSFQIGISGLKATGEGMAVIGDNIANASTFGFKASRAEFQDVLSRSLKGIDGGDQIGAGTKLAHVTPVFNQGTVKRTETVTDLAINGDGFFVAETNFGTGYTRDGSLRFDKEGYLITSDGFKVIGYQADADGKEITNAPGEMRLGSTTIPAKATTGVDVNMNLDTRAKITAFDPLKPDETSEFNTSMTVFDNIGTERLVTVYFNKVANNNWQYHAMVDAKDAAGGIEGGPPVKMAGGSIVFNDKGVLQQEVETQNAFNFSDGAAPGQQIKFNFGKSITEGGDGSDGSTQYGSESSVARHTQDGYSAATLASMSFDDNGVLTAVYDNGESKFIGQVAIAKFANNEGLFKVGRNLYKESRKSGQGTLGKPTKDGRGTIFAKSIELSNVDIADEFVNLMTTQRNFQANAKAIQTTDAMLQEVLNLKR